MRYQQALLTGSIFLTALLPALLLELAMFLAHGSAEVREQIRQFPKRTIATGLFCSALLPYLVYSLFSGTLNWLSLTWLVVIAGIFSFYYVWLPPTGWADVLLTLLFAAVLLTDRFPLIYIQVTPRLAEKILGDLMLARVVGIAVFCIRGMPGVAYGFLPSKDDLRIGIREFVYILPVAAVLSYLTGFAKVRPAGAPGETALKAIGVAIGIHILVSLREELMVRGLLQPVLQRWFHSPMLGMAVTSVLFGLTHLGFAHKFPNWRFVIMATAAGWFYGRAFAATQSVRAAMVTHTLTVVLWRVFLV